MSKFIVEILEEINQDPVSIEKYKANTALRILFEYAFDPSKKFLLPEGTPPFKEDDAPLGMSPSNFTMEMRRLYIFCREDLGKVRRESLFISLLEGLHPSEARILIAVKEQNLSVIYPNITHKLVYDAGFISVLPPVEVEVPKQVEPEEVPVVEESSLESQPVVEKKAKGRGRPKKTGQEV